MNRKPIASLCLSNVAALGILDIVNGIDDYAITMLVCGESKSRPAQNKIRYNAKGDAFIIKGGKRFYLNDFMRV